jgi:hypothetical protein
MTTDQSTPLSTHKRHLSGVLSRYAGNFVLCGVCIALGLGMLVLGFVKPRSGTLLPGGLILAGSVVWLLPLAAKLPGGQRRVQTSPDGLTWQDGRGEHHCRWDEVVAVYRGETIVDRTYRVRDLRVVLASGKQVRFDQSLSNYDRLAEVVQAKTTEHLLPAKRAEVAAGAEFGPVTLHTDGITLGRKRFLWSEVEQYTVCNGCLIVFPEGYKGQRYEHAVLGAIPNYRVLLELIQELGHLPTPPEQSILFVGRK